MIREKFYFWNYISRNMGKLASYLPFPPNFYSWMTLPLGLAGLWLITQGYLITAVSLFIVAGLFDIIDGALARHLNKHRKYGAFLDGSLDRYVDFFLLFSYFWLPIQPVWMGLDKWLCIASFLIIMPSYEVAYANHRQAVPDPNERIVWRILNRGEMFPLMLLIVVVSKYSAIWAGYLLVALVILSAITTLQTFIKPLHYAATHYKD